MGDINVGAAGNPQKPEENEAKKQEVKEQQAATGKERLNEEITSGLNGKSKTPAAPTNTGAGGIFGMPADVDTEKLNDLTNSFMNFTMNATQMPFGMGTSMFTSTITTWFQSFLSCFNFNGMNNNMLNGMNSFNNFAAATGAANTVETKLLDAAEDKKTVATDDTSETPNTASDAPKAENVAGGNVAGKAKAVKRKPDGTKYTPADVARELITNPKIKDKNDWSVLLDDDFSKEALDLAMNSDTCKKKIGSGRLSYKKNEDGSVVVKRNYSDNLGHTNTDTYTITFDKSGKPAEIKQSRKLFHHIGNDGKQIFNTYTKSVKFKDGVAVPEKTEAHNAATKAKKETPTSAASYRKTSVNGFYTKDGAYYKYSLETGKYNKCDMVYSDGRYVMNGVTYKADSTKAGHTVCAHKGQPSVYTITHYTGYKSEKNSAGGTTLTSKDGYETLIFDKTGKLTRRIYDNKGGGFFGTPQKSTIDYTYNNKSQVATIKVSDMMKHQTQTTEYITNTKGLKSGSTTTKSKPYTQQEMDSSGRVSTNKLQNTSTVSTKIENGIAIRKTITKTSIVR